jgi:flagellar basal-body rod protein FlgB
MGLFDTRTGTVIRGALDGLAARHRTLVNNVANLETPGFQAKDVPFEEELRRVRDDLARNPAQVSSARKSDFTPVPRLGDTGRVDGNGVQVDSEITHLEENALTYETVIQAARARGELLKAAISEGRK